MLWTPPHRRLLPRHARGARGARGTAACLGVMVLGMVVTMGAACLADPPRRSDVWVSGLWTDRAMKHVAKLLRPRGMTGFTGRPLTDLSPEQRQKKQAYLQRRDSVRMSSEGTSASLPLARSAITWRASFRHFASMPRAGARL